MGDNPAPIIVSALFVPPDQAMFDALRRAHFPPDRNWLDAHLTLFHHLPPSIGAELDALLDDLTIGAARPDAAIGPLRNLGRGVAIDIAAPALAAIRARIADRFADLLTPQDRNGWKGHVTIQNKVPPHEARALRDALEPTIVRRPVGIAALASWYYRDGPWELRRRHGFGRPINRAGRRPCS